MPHTIELFMWGFQEHFRLSLQIFARRVFEGVAPTLQPIALLVGVIEPGEAGARHPVCVEPEKGPVGVALFSNLEARVQALIASHPRRNMLYGDARANAAHPGWLRADAVRSAVRERLANYDRDHGTRSFCGGPIVVEGYRVVPVLQVPASECERLPQLRKASSGEFAIATSFQESLLGEILRQASTELLLPEPGASLAGTFERDPDDVLRAAGRSLMYTPGLAGGHFSSAGGLFDAFNRISALRYEGGTASGRMVIARKGHDCVHAEVEFLRPIPLREANWARKVLEMASPDQALLCDNGSVYGLGKLCDAYDPVREDAFVIDVVDHYTWELRHSSTLLMRTRYGIPNLPRERLSDTKFRATVRRRFQSSTAADAEVIWALVRVASEQRHGTLVVVSEAAGDEAARLASQATPIAPSFLGEAMVRRVTRIDGALLVDPTGRCHAIGVILDGMAIADGDPSRGARLNSARRYVASASAVSMAVVISEDGHIDVLPELRDRVRKSEIERHVDALHRLADDVESDWHEHRNWLDEHRFYLNAEQCVQVNADLEKLEEAVRSQVGRPWVVVRPFHPDAEMNESYFCLE